MLKFVISDLRPILIIACLEFFTLQVCKEIIKDTRSKNRFSISYSIVFLWLIMSVSARLFCTQFLHRKNGTTRDS